MWLLAPGAALKRRPGWHLFYFILYQVGVPQSFLARLHEVHRAIAVTPVVHVPVPLRVRVRMRVTLALKFSRSPYLDNRKHSYLDHRYPVGLAFIPWHRAPGSRPGGGVGG